jgi:hypothetical protein
MNQGAKGHDDGLETIETDPNLAETFQNTCNYLANSPNCRQMSSNDGIMPLTNSTWQFPANSTQARPLKSGRAL